MAEALRDVGELLDGRSRRHRLCVFVGDNSLPPSIFAPCVHDVSSAAVSERRPSISALGCSIERTPTRSSLPKRSYFVLVGRRRGSKWTPIWLSNWPNLGARSQNWVALCGNYGRPDWT